MPVLPGTENDSNWQPVIDRLADAPSVDLGPMHSFQARQTPRRLLFTTSYYKFAAKLIRANLDRGTRGRVLDVGCGEGLGTYLVAKEIGSAHGVDFDEGLIEVAQRNWTDAKLDDDSPACTFDAVDFLTMEAEPFDAVINFDVIEHIRPDNAAAFIEGLHARTQPGGLAIVGTPNQTSAVHASAVTNAGHINLYEGARLHDEMAAVFDRVLMFGANDEVVHTGFLPMCHYLIAVGLRGPEGSA